MSGRIDIDPRSATEKFSEVTRGLLVLNHRAKACAQCRKTRSMAQYAPGDDLCAQCRRRA